MAGIGSVSKRGTELLDASVMVPRCRFLQSPLNTDKPRLQTTSLKSDIFVNCTTVWKTFPSPTPDAHYAVIPRPSLHKPQSSYCKPFDLAARNPPV